MKTRKNAGMAEVFSRRMVEERTSCGFFDTCASIDACVITTASVRFVLPFVADRASKVYSQNYETIAPILFRSQQQKPEAR